MCVACIKRGFPAVRTENIHNVGREVLFGRLLSETRLGGVAVCGRQRVLKTNCVCSAAASRIAVSGRSLLAGAVDIAVAVAPFAVAVNSEDPRLAAGLDIGSGEGLP